MAGILFDRQKDYHWLAWKGILLEGRDRIFVIQTAAAFFTSFSALLMEAQDLLLVESMAPLSSNKQKEERWGTLLVDSNHSLRQLSLYCRGPWITIWIGVPIRISLFRPRRQDDWVSFPTRTLAIPCKIIIKNETLCHYHQKERLHVFIVPTPPCAFLWTGKPLLSLSSGQVVKQKNALPSITRVSERLLSVQSRTITTRIWAVSF